MLVLKRLYKNENVTSGNVILSAVRYGSMDDAQRGTALSRDLLAPEIATWFSGEHRTLMGVAQRVLEV